MTPGLITLRWLTFLSVMTAIGLFCFRTLIARPVGAIPAVTRAFAAAVALALIVTPIYVLLATAQFAIRSFWSFGSLIPLMGVSAFGRGYLRLELLLALFAFAAAVALWLDRPERPRRSVVGLLSLWGALLAAGAVLLVPGTAGHAAQTAPRPASLLLDWAHLASGSVWLGGLVGLLLVARSGGSFMTALKRFSNTAFVSVMLLLGSGVGATVIHLPTLASLWQTGYGKAILVKAGLLLAAMLIASVNLVRTRRSLPLLRQLVAGEVVLVTSAVVAAAVLSSLPPPPKALASLGAPAATVGPGPVSKVVEHGGYRVEVRVTPNKVAVPDEFAVRITRNGAPIRGATVIATFAMLDMEMPTQAYRLAETSPGVVRALVRGARHGRPVGRHLRDSAVGRGRVRRRRRRPRARMRIAALIAVCLVAAVAAGSARADGDPASDYLLVQRVFVPYEAATAAKQKRDLTAAVTAANKAGFKIRVAVIESAYDLGSVTALWRKPQTYARFLGAELAFVYSQRLLVVMPNGFGFNWPKHSPTAAYAVLAKVRLTKGVAGLLESATAAVQALAKAG